MNVYGLVPARDGSKALPGKNLRKLGGVPLVARAIHTLSEVTAVTCVCLSTDSEVIASIGRQAGAWVPFLRPDELATDTASVVDVVRHALDYMDDVERIVMVQPTSPFIRTKTIAAALEYAQLNDLPYLQTISPVKEHPAWMRKLVGNYMRCAFPRSGSLRRQDLEPLYVLNGAVNIYTADALRADSLPQPAHYIIDRIEGLDIDDAIDWKFAEGLYCCRNRRQPRRR